jgi:bifunctional non-homologous end joining protein LigD
MLGDEEGLYVTSTKQIVLLAQQNAIEVHGWGTTLPKWEHPDWIVFDLDPDESLPFEEVVDAAFTTRDALKTLGLQSWVKTTGGKGLHVVVPIARRYDWETVKNASHRVATLMAEAAPDRFVATMSKKARVGKVFIDYLRNGEGATAILPYSARARPGLPVAMPIAWSDLREVDPGELTIATVPKLLARRRNDPWEDLLTTRQLLPRELRG